MHKGILIVIVWTSALLQAHPQTIITRDPSYTTPASGAILDVRSINKGFLPPRVSLSSTTDVTTIPSPATGLLVYNTNGAITGGNGTGYYYYNGSAWRSFETGMHYIGESFNGGIVFWIDETGRHGLIVPASDQSTGTAWYAGTNMYTLSSFGGVGGGEPGTFNILASQRYGDGTNYAARQCAFYEATSGSSTLGGWYLPNITELTLMYENRTLIGGFSTGNYWTSAESSNINAFGINFSTGAVSAYTKSTSNRVRCVRKF